MFALSAMRDWNKGINDMICYAMLWDLDKNASIKKRLPLISKKNNRKPKFSTNLQSEHLVFQIKTFESELKQCCMQCYGMICRMGYYKIVYYGMLFQCYAMEFHCYARLLCMS